MQEKSLSKVAYVLALFFAFASLMLAGCGGGGSNSSPDSSTVVPPPSANVELHGRFAVAPTLTATSAVPTKKDHEPIEVTVEEHPGIRTTVADDGTFTLRGLPAGRFTVVFHHGDEVIGTLEFEEVAANQQITITVNVVNNEVVLVDEDRRGIGHAGIELEGLVENVVTVDVNGDSTFVIAGRTVIARPGVTAIRRGTTRLTVEDIEAGMRVHVKGTAIEGSTDILAFEIKVQQDDDGAGGGDNEQVTICHIPPGNPSRRHTITISVNAWPAHQAHGDTEGPCS